MAIEDNSGMTIPEGDRQHIVGQLQDYLVNGGALVRVEIIDAVREDGTIIEEATQGSDWAHPPIIGRLGNILSRANALPKPQPEPPVTPKLANCRPAYDTNNRGGRA
jgi:hypothetical protein